MSGIVGDKVGRTFCGGGPLSAVIWLLGGAENDEIQYDVCSCRSEN